jgi:hypothetical protein
LRTFTQEIDKGTISQNFETVKILKMQDVVTIGTSLQDVGTVYQCRCWQQDRNFDYILNSAEGNFYKYQSWQQANKIANNASSAGGGNK